MSITPERQALHDRLKAFAAEIKDQPEADAAFVVVTVLSIAVLAGTDNYLQEASYRHLAELKLALTIGPQLRKFGLL